MSPSQPAGSRTTSADHARQAAYSRARDALRQEEAKKRSLKNVWPEAMTQQKDRLPQLPYLGRRSEQNNPSSESLPFAMDMETAGPRTQQLPAPPVQPRGASFMVRAQAAVAPDAPARYVPASSTDPSKFRLQPISERPISAPIQPRVTDMSVSIERDAAQVQPTFDVSIRFKFTMQPGELR